MAGQLGVHDAAAAVGQRQRPGDLGHGEGQRVVQPVEPRQQLDLGVEGGGRRGPSGGADDVPRAVGADRERDVEVGSVVLGRTGRDHVQVPHGGGGEGGEDTGRAGWHAPTVLRGGLLRVQV